MRKRFTYGAAILLLTICVVLVFWQGSFDFGQLGPSNTNQTLILWAVSTLIFLLMVTLGFILFRTGVKLYIERRTNREGSRIKTKLVVGALALSFMPSVFLVFFSFQVLNRNLDKWFARPLDAELQIFSGVSSMILREKADETALQAELLAVQPETVNLILTRMKTAGFLQQFAQRQPEIVAAAIFREGSDIPLDSFGSVSADRSDATQGHADIRFGGKVIGRVEIASRIPVDIQAMRNTIAGYNHYYGQLSMQRRWIKYSYVLFMVLITLFVLFVATWLALFFAKQISVPIAALLRAAGEVRQGNLRYRVEVGAIDELAMLVRGFNEMTRDLEASSRELDARRRFTEAILESIPTGVISITAEGRIQRVNRALERVFPAEMLAGATRLEDLFSREDAAELRYLMKRARRTGAVSRQFELQMRNQRLHIAATVSALEEKITSGFVIVLEDTSDLLRAQKAAAWHEVARRVAHEIKNPLTPIALSAERIERQFDRRAVDPELGRIVRECTSTITQSVDSVKCLVDEFSQFARFPAAQPSKGDLNEAIENAMTVFQGRLDGIELKTDLAPGLPPVNIDREQFKRVVVNLVDNAAEAMQDSLVKRIAITTRAGAADSIELIITDTGCGVSAEDKEKLFLPYFSTKGRGTGLGLAIVNHILADHNATIRVEDNQPLGARFIIEIPAMVEQEAATVQV